MRYFKCDDLKPKDREIITQDISLTEEEKKRDRQGKFLNIFGTVLFFVTFVASFIGVSMMILKIPLPENPFLLILIFVGMLVLDFAAFVVSVLVGTLVSAPIYKKAQQKLVIQKRIYFDKALITLREYYGWTEPCLVTKCYDSADPKFKNRDVCIFLVADELRITADLKHGFSIRENDLGCYAFGVDEISVDQIQGERFLMTELKCGEIVFHLGRRAKGFIEKHLTSKTNFYSSVKKEHQDHEDHDL